MTKTKYTRKLTEELILAGIASFLLVCCCMLDIDNRHMFSVAGTERALCAAGMGDAFPASLDWRVCMISPCGLKSKQQPLCSLSPHTVAVSLCSPDTMPSASLVVSFYSPFR